MDCGPYYRILFSYKEKWSYETFRKVGETKTYYAEWGVSDPER